MPRETTTRTPLLWLLAPFALGIMGARLFPHSLALWPFAISCFLAACSLVAVKGRTAIWAALLSAALAAAGYAYTTAMDRDRAVQAGFPDREALLTIEVLRLYESTSSRARGIARVRATEKHLHRLVGSKVYFSARPPKDALFVSPAEHGSRIEAIGVLSPLDHSDDASGFTAYLRSSGVAAEFTRGEVYFIKPANPTLNSWLNGAREAASKALSTGIGETSPESRSYRAMLLGMKGELEGDQKRLFLENGAMHLFAISGLHIGVIAACGHALWVVLRMPRPWIPIPNLVLIALFVMITGGAPSAWRAFLMIACFYLCLASRRQAASLNGLILSALICLIINPLQLFLAGFQLSYATVASILLYGIPMSRKIDGMWKPFDHIPRQLWGPGRKAILHSGRFLISGFSISFSAFLASATLSIIYFNTVSFIGVLTNIVLLPMASLVIVSGFLSLSLATLSAAPLSSLFNHAAQAILWTMHSILDGLNTLGQMHARFIDPPVSLLYTLSIILIACLFFGYSKSWRFKTESLFLFPLAYTTICLASASL